MKCLTFNVWMEPIYVQERMQEIIRIITESTPDVVCLQEVTPEIYQIFKQQLSTYTFSKARLTQGYDVLTLVQRNYKTKFLRVNLPSIMGRNLEVTIFSSKDKSGCQTDWLIGNFHLESGFFGQHPLAKVKYQQLNICFSIIEDQLEAKRVKNDRKVRCLIMGDTNFGFRDYPKVHRKWKDAWVIDGKLAEYQFTNNGVTNTNLKHRYKNRMDRIYLRTDLLRLDDFKLVGTKTIPGINIHPSDHYGILVNVSTQTHPLSNEDITENDLN